MDWVFLYANETQKPQYYPFIKTLLWCCLAVLTKVQGGGVALLTWQKSQKPTAS